MKSKHYPGNIRELTDSLQSKGSEAVSANLWTPTKHPKGLFLFCTDKNIPQFLAWKSIMVCCSQLKILDQKSSFRPLMPSSTRVSL